MITKFKVANYKGVGDIITILIQHGSTYADIQIGKSSMLQAIMTMKEMLLDGARSASIDPLPYQPNLIKKFYDSYPTSFLIETVYEDVHYKYAYTYTDLCIVSESLMIEGKLVYIRAMNEFNSNLIKGSAKIQQITRPNALIMSMGDMLNLPEMTLFMRSFNYIDIPKDKDIMEAMDWDRKLRLLDLLNIGINPTDAGYIKDFVIYNHRLCLVIIAGNAELRYLPFRELSETLQNKIVLYAAGLNAVRNNAMLLVDDLDIKLKKDDIYVFTELFVKSSAQLLYTKRFVD